MPVADDVLRLEASYGSEGAPEFGSINDLGLLSDGSLVVLDGTNRRVVVLDPATGDFRTWGRKGAGPTEFGTIIGLWVDPQDNIGTVDSRNRRVCYWSRSGELTVSAELDGIPLQVVSWEGKAYIKGGAFGSALAFHPVAPPGELLEASPSDPSTVPAREALTCQWCTAAAGPEGLFLVGGEQLDYRISLLNADGRVIEQWIRDDLEPVARSEESVRELSNRLADAAARAGTTPNVLKHLPWFSRNNALGMDKTGRVWALRAAPTEGSRLDVFVRGRDTPLFTAAVEEQLQGIRVVGDTLLAHGIDATGAPAVYVYTMASPP